MDADRSRAELRRTAILIWAPGLAILALALVVSLTNGISIRSLTQDAVTVLDGPFYVGAISNLGLVLWAMTVAVCLFAAIWLVPPQEGPWRRYLLVAGIFTAVLLVDDMILVHEEIMPSFGISGDLYGVLYVLAMAAFLLVFWRPIRRSNQLLLWAALFLFAASAAVDVGHGLVEEVIPTRFVLLAEDGTKLLGIGTWLAYFVSTARMAVVGAPLEVSTTPDVTAPAPLEGDAGDVMPEGGAKA